MNVAKNLITKCFHKKAGAMLCLLLCTALLSFSISTASFAAAPTSPCDPEYMDALEARAWLEAQREISQNKNFIFKPDSVLEYTCFDYFLNEAASNFKGNRQFSETDKWDGHPAGFSPTTTDDALSEVVMKPFVAYLTANFNTKGNMGAYLNNRRTQEYTPQGSVTGGTAYKCAEMQKVWKLARCMNFNEKSENKFDGFFDFKYYEGTDVRQETDPWALMCTIADPAFAKARIEAFNQDQVLFEIATEAPFMLAEGNSTPYLEDDIVTHLNLILPGTCDPKGKVPTGIKVQRPDLNGGAPYDEVVCTNPGCSATTGGQCQ